MYANRLISGIKIITALAITASASLAQASLDFVETDLLTPGDGYLFKDVTTQREWVDVTKTFDMSVDDFFASPNFANKDFQLATQADVIQMFQNAGAVDIDVSLDDESFSMGNVPAYHLLTELMEFVRPTTPDPFLYGYYANAGDAQAKIARMQIRFNSDLLADEAAFHLNYNGDYDYDDDYSSIGVFAFRQLEIIPLVEEPGDGGNDPNAVPLPTASLAGVLGFTLMSVMRRKRR